MTHDDELRARLQRIDPAPIEVAVEPPTTPSARAHLESIMRTNTDTEGLVVPLSAPPYRRRWLLAGAAAIVAIAGVGAVALAGDDDGADVASGPPLELSLGAADTMASCLPVDAALLADMPVAFAGTATAVDGEAVTLEVDRWYQGGDAEVVELRATGGQAALIAGFDLEVGERYLISASEGTVTFCGFSGPATPELTALFDEAFPG